MSRFNLKAKQLAQILQKPWSIMYHFQLATWQNSLTCWNCVESSENYLEVVRIPLSDELHVPQSKRRFLSLKNWFRENDQAVGSKSVSFDWVLNSTSFMKATRLLTQNLHNLKVDSSNQSSHRFLISSSNGSEFDFWKFLMASRLTPDSDGDRSSWC